MRKMRKQMLIIGMIFLALGLFFRETKASSQVESVKMEVECGAGGAVKSTEMIPVTVRLENKGDDFSGSIVIEENISSIYGGIRDRILELILPQNGGQDAANRQSRNIVYRKEVELKAGEVKNEKLFISAPNISESGNLIVKLRNADEKNVQSRSLELYKDVGNAGITAAVLEKDGSMALDLKKQKFGYYSQYMINAVSLLPEELSADYFILENLNIIIFRDFDRKDLSEEQGKILDVWEKEGGRIFSGEDAVQQIRMELTDDDLSEMENSSRLDIGWDTISNTPVMEQPSLGIFVLLLTIYALLAGPILYLLLKKIKQRYYVFQGIVILSVLFVLFILTAGSSTRLIAPFITYCGIYEQKEDYLDCDIKFGIQAPYNKSYSLFVDNTYALVPGIGADDFLNPITLSIRESSNKIQIEELEDHYRVSMAEMPSFTQNYFEARKQFGLDEKKKLSADIVYNGQEMKGIIRNDTDFTFEYLILVMDNQVFVAGEIPAGQSRTTEKMDRYSFNSIGLSKLLRERLNTEQWQRKEQLADIYNKIIHMYEQAGTNRAYLLGIIKDAQPDFQMDSGYRTYGSSVYLAPARISYKADDKIYCPFGSMIWEEIQEDGESTGVVFFHWAANEQIMSDDVIYRYYLKQCLWMAGGEEAEVSQFQFYYPDYAEGENILPWSGEIQLYNYETGNYDVLHDPKKVIEGPEIEKYVLPDGVLQVRFVGGEKSREESEVLPFIQVVGEVNSHVED